MSNSAPPTSVYLGVDVAKATLDGCCSKQQFASIPNNPKGHLQLLAQTSQLFPGSLMHLVCEATGGYEQALVRAATAAGWKVSIVSPSRVRHFAKACGLLAKTDAIDAKLILNFAETVQPLALQEFPSWTKDLQDLVALKQQIQVHLTALSNQLEIVSCKKASAAITRLSKAHKKEIGATDKLIAALIAAHPQLAQNVERLSALEGIGKVTAAAILALMPELGKIGDKQAAALAGLAPYNRDSGPCKGQRSISGGRSKLRALLYMPALTAVRCNPILKPFYKALKDRGKKALVAITAVMRKLITLCNRLLSDPNFSLAH
jgi:transposase